MKYLIPVSLFLISCTISFPEKFPNDDWTFYYVNNSSHQLVISSRVDTFLVKYKLDSVLNKNDTIRLFDGTSITDPFGVNASVTIIFDSIKCFTFGEALQIDPATDIRSHFAYQMIKQGEDGNIYKCYYTITDSLYDKASDCQ